APLYYWTMAPFYYALQGKPLDTQVLWLRWISVAIASLAIPLCFLVAKSVFRDVTVALGCAAVVAAMPEFLVDMARIGNECLSVVLFTLLLWLASETLRGERRAPAMIIVLALGLLTKAYFLTAIPGVALVAAIDIRR